MNGKPVIQLQSGIFTISLDFELIWGTLDKPKHKRFRRLCAIERAEVIDRLLALFAEYRISATWCTVGHLFLDPSHAGQPDAPILYARDLVEKIRNCRVPQEIGSHTFTHKVFGDPSCTRSDADQDLAACTRVAAEMGLQLKSFVFPRNRIGHVELLPQHGFTSYRGQDPQWYTKTNQRGWAHRIGHLVDIFCATTPTAVLPVWHEEGIWEIPGSMLFTPSHGLRRLVPAKARVHRARKGLRRAVESKKIFHLWFHPTDVVVRKEAMLDALRQILEYASELRESGRLSILTMAEITELFTRAGGQASKDDGLSHKNSQTKVWTTKTPGRGAFTHEPENRPATLDRPQKAMACPTSWERKLRRHFVWKDSLKAVTQGLSR